MADTLGGSNIAVKPHLPEQAHRGPTTTPVTQCALTEGIRDFANRLQTTVLVLAHFLTS